MEMQDQIRELSAFILYLMARDRCFGFVLQGWGCYTPGLSAWEN